MAGPEVKWGLKMLAEDLENIPEDNALTNSTQRPAVFLYLFSGLPAKKSRGDSLRAHNNQAKLSAAFRV